MPEVMRRFEATRFWRESSKREATRKQAAQPYAFGENRHPDGTYLLVPSVSSERRKYIPMGFVSPNIVSSNLNLIIPRATRFDFGILTSQMHMAWMRAVAGRLKSDYRYSKDIVYNNFIWPDVTDDQKAQIEQLAQTLLNARAEYPNSSLADLYDPLTMPVNLAKAHRALDRAVDRLYQKSGFTNDPARVAHLFELYRKRDE